MGRSKRESWIDKNKSTTFKLVHRSQRDPLQADSEASQHVLLDVSKDRPAEPPTKTKRQRLLSHGIYYEDDYNYEQHLRKTGDFYQVSMEPEIDEDSDAETEIIHIPAKPVLPKEVFASETEVDIGMLNLAAPVSGPRLDWDPDILAALDSDNEDFLEDESNLLEDDFIVLANENEDGEHDCSDGDDAGDQFVSSRQAQWLQEQAVGYAGEDSVTQKIPPLERLDEDDELSADADLSGLSVDDDDLGSMPDFSDEETKTRFTNYSMSSSVIRRNEGLTTLDDKFEQMFAEYDEDEIGPLDHEDIDGRVSTTGPMMEYLLEKFEAQHLERTVPENAGVPDQFLEGSDTDSAELEELELPDGSKDQKWDAESIISTYSNLYNHPKLIEEPWRKPKRIQLSKKLGVPVEGFPSRGFTLKDLKQLDNEYEAKNGESMTATSTKSWHLKRDKSLTPEERRARKQELKAERRERRMEKKNTKVAFKHEEVIQKRQKTTQIYNFPGKVIV